MSSSGTSTLCPNCRRQMRKSTPFSTTVRGLARMESLALDNRTISTVENLMGSSAHQRIARTPKALQRALVRPGKITPVQEEADPTPEELAVLATLFRRNLFTAFASHQFFALILVSVFTLMGTFRGFWSLGMCWLAFGLMVGSLLLLFWFRFHNTLKWVLLFIFTIFQAAFFCGVNWYYSTRCGMFAQLY